MILQMIRNNNNRRTKLFSVLFLAIICAINCDAQIWEGKEAMFHYSNTGESVYAIDDNVAGIYMLSVANKNGVKTEKIIRQKKINYN